jgi:hypothetical protein
LWGEPTGKRGPGLRIAADQLWSARNAGLQVEDHAPEAVDLAALDDLERLESVEGVVRLRSSRPRTEPTDGGDGAGRNAPDRPGTFSATDVFLAAMVTSTHHYAGKPQGQFFFPRAFRADPEQTPGFFPRHLAEPQAMITLRAQTVDPSFTPWYDWISRCVQRAFLGDERFHHRTQPTGQADIGPACGAQAIGVGWRDN